jgi:hypothetical protein
MAKQSGLLTFTGKLGVRPIPYACFKRIKKIYFRAGSTIFASIT